MPRGMRSTFSREFAAYSVMMMPGNERPDVNAVFIFKKIHELL